MLEYRASKSRDKATRRRELSNEKYTLENKIEFYSPWSSGTKTPAYPMQVRKPLK